MVGQAILPAAAFQAAQTLRSPFRRPKNSERHLSGGPNSERISRSSPQSLREALRKTSPPLGHCRPTAVYYFSLHGTLPASRVFPPERLTSGNAFVTMDRPLLSETRGNCQAHNECLARWGRKIWPLPVACICDHAEPRVRACHSPGGIHALVGPIEGIHCS